jgi:protein O-mannosyl-transferase
MAYWLVPFFVALAVFAAGANGTFVYDDVPIIQLNPSLGDPSNWLGLWRKSYNDNVDNLYRPMVIQTFAIQAWLDVVVRGKTPEPLAWPFRVVNIVLHAVVCAQLSVLAKRLFLHRLDEATSRSVGLWAGLLFAVHPVHTEAVVGIVGRADLMCAVGMLGVLLVMLRDVVRRRNVMLAGAGLVMAVLSKEFALLTWLVAMALAIACTLDGRRLNFVNRSGAWLTLLLCSVTSAFVVVKENVLRLRFTWVQDFLDASIQPLKGMGVFERLPASVGIVGHYAEVVVFPWRLSIDRSHAIATTNVAGDVHFWIGITVLVAGVVALGWAVKSRQFMVVFLLVAAAVTYGLVSNSVFMIATIFGERLVYITTIFLFIALGWAVSRGGMKAKVVMSMVLALLAVRTLDYTVRWRDRDTLYRYLLERDPHNARLAVLMSTNLIQERRFHEALEYANIAIRINPDYFHGYLAAASAHRHLGNFEEALRMASESVRCWPDHLPSILFRSEVRSEMAKRVQPTTQATKRSTP